MKAVRAVLVVLVLVVAIGVAALWLLGRGLGGNFDSADMPELAESRSADAVGELARPDMSDSRWIGGIRVDGHHAEDQAGQGGNRFHRIAMGLHHLRVREHLEKQVHVMQVVGGFQCPALPPLATALFLPLQEL